MAVRATKWRRKTSDGWREEEGQGGSDGEGGREETSGKERTHRDVGFDENDRCTVVGMEGCWKYKDLLHDQLGLQPRLQKKRAKKKRETRKLTHHPARPLRSAPSSSCPSHASAPLR